MSIELDVIRLNTPHDLKEKIKEHINLDSIFSFSDVWFWQGAFCVYAYAFFFFSS